MGLALTMTVLLVAAVLLGRSPEPAGRTVVTVRLWDEQVAAAYRESFDEFSRAHPDIDVRVNVVAYATYFDTLRTDVAGGSADDIFWVSNAYFANYADSGRLIFPTHFPTPSGGTIARDGAGYSFVFDGEQHRAVHQHLLPRLQVAHQRVRVQVAEQEHHLEKQEAGGPYRRRAAEPRQDAFGDDRLHLKQQEGAYQNGQCVEDHL